MGIVGKFSYALRTVVFAAGVVVAMTVATSANAGVLSGHASAYEGTWTGSTPFDNGVGLSGTIDWAVFAPGDFPFTGYTPTAGELTYAFQIYSTGTLSIHSLMLNDINGAADNIGSFADLAGQVPTSAAIGTQIEWNFAGIDPGSNSSGLAFSSIKTPQNLFGVVVNGGTYSVAIPLPIPGMNDIPEPASLALMSLGGLLMLRKRS